MHRFTSSRVEIATGIILGCPEIGHTGTPQNYKIEGKTMTNGFEMMWGMRYPTFGEPMINPHLAHANMLIS